MYFCLISLPHLFTTCFFQLSLQFNLPFPFFHSSLFMLLSYFHLLPLIFRNLLLYCFFAFFFFILSRVFMFFVFLLLLFLLFYFFYTLKCIIYLIFLFCYVWVGFSQFADFQVIVSSHVTIMFQQFPLRLLSDYPDCARGPQVL